MGGMALVKSLGKLVARLVDEIALCGKAGAPPPDIITHIKTIYLTPSDKDSHFHDNVVDEVASPGITPSSLDDAFLEYVWRLLIRHPEVHLGKDDQNDSADSAAMDVGASYCSSRKQLPTGISTKSSAQTLAVLTPKSLGASFATEEVAQGKALESSSLEDGLADPATLINRKGIEQWTENVPSTLSSGITPARPVPDLVGSNIGHGSRLFASENRIWHTISGHEPDYSRIPSLDFVCLSIIAACGPSGITQNDLVRLSGQDKRSLPMRTDRLHNNGYIIKRPVTIFANKALLHTSLLTLKRFAESSEATAVELTEAATKFRKKKKPRRRRTIINAHCPDQGQISGSRLAFSPGTFEANEDGTMCGPPMPNAVAQWTPDRNLWNQIFDIVHQSGMEGTTLNGISTGLMGPQYRKPMEDLLAKLASSWQLSQPSHLRHLAIVRDSVQKGKTSVYIYYTFESYQKLVENGQRMWEAVLMLQDKKMGDMDTLMHAHSDVDEYGFPKLDPTQFQGFPNNASLIECAPVLSESSRSIKTRTLRRSKMNDNSRSPGRTSPILVSDTTMNNPTRMRKKGTAVMKGVGRPRIYPPAGIPAGIESWDVDDIKGLIESQRMHDAYQKTKIRTEIERRSQLGEEPVLVAHELLEASDALRREQGQEPISMFLVMQILHEYAGGAEPPQQDETAAKLKSILKELENKKYIRGKWAREAGPTESSFGPDTGILVPPSPNVRSPTLKSVGIKTSYWHLPSIAAHSRPHNEIQDANVAESQTCTTSNKIIKKGRQRKTVNMDADSTIEEPKSKRQKSAMSNDCTSVITPILASDMSTPAVPTLATSQSSTIAHDPSPGIIHNYFFEQYKKAVGSVSRPHDGVFISKSAQRYRKRDDPASMPIKRYQVAIFKLTALHDLLWFSKDQRPTVSSLSNRYQMPEQTAEAYEHSGGVSKSSVLASDRSKALIAPTDGAVNRPSTHPGASIQVSALKPPPVARSSEWVSKDPMPLRPVQDPSCFIFKLSGLQTLGWFRHDPSQLEKANHPLLHSRSEADSAPGAQPSETLTAVLGPSDTSYYKAPTMEEQQPAVLKHTRTTHKSRSLGNSGRTGGSTAILRRDIIVQLVKKCGGVFPEAGAMRIPFGHEWKARGQSGVPERNTVINAVNMCCEQGKLRRIIFSFKDHHGITATSTLFALPDIDPKDPKVREMQDMIKERHPQSFVPDAVTPKDTAFADSKKNKQEQAIFKAAEKRAKVKEAKAMALRSPEEREAFLTALQSSDRSEQEKVALSRLTEPSVPKIRRLDSIKKPTRSLVPLPMSMTENTAELVPGGRVSVLSQDLALVDPTIDRARHSDQESWSMLRPREDVDDDSIIESERSRQRLRGPARNRTQIQRKQRKYIQGPPQLSDCDFSDLPLMPKQHTVSSLIDPMLEEVQVNPTFPARFSGTQIARVFSEQPAGSRKRKHAESEGPIFPGFMDPVLLYHRVTGTFSATFPGFRKGMIELSQRGKKRYSSKAIVPLRYQSPFSNQQLARKPIRLSQGLGNGQARFPGFVSPMAFHSPSGTFAVSFLGFRPASRRTPGAGTFREGKPCYSKQTRIVDDTEKLKVTENLTGYTRKRRRADTVVEGSDFKVRAKPSPDPFVGSPFKLRRVRGPQTARQLGEGGAIRLSIAVMVVRILTGGIRMAIDWKLVAKVFAPTHDESFVRSRWSSVLTQLRHNQVKLDADFQTLFTKAYAVGAVPKIDFEHLEDYDWKWLVEWTIAHLDAPANFAPELCADRAFFDQSHAIQDVFQQKDLTHFYELEGFSVMDLRKSVINRQAHVYSPFPRQSALHSSMAPPENEQIAIARSWICANIVGPAETYDSRIARIKLNALPAANVEAALKSLLQEKLIVERSKSHVIPGREYELSDYFAKRLRSNISPTQFHRAVAFKEELDNAFEAKGSARWSCLAHDGDAMALLNLVAQQRVRIMPIDPPLNNWGHTDEGYSSRQMDKSKLNFEVKIVPTSSYIVGSPLEPLPPPPAPHLDASRQQLSKIPVWYDINDSLIPTMWRRALAAVLGLLAIRSGVAAEELHVNVKPSLELWEVKEVLYWMLEAKLAGKMGKEGFRTNEWWWMALGSPPDIGVKE